MQKSVDQDTQGAMAWNSVPGDAAMKRREMLSTTGAAVLGAATFPLSRIAAGTTKKQKVLYFTRNVGYYHSVVRRNDGELSHSERALVEMAKTLGIEVECTKDGRIFDKDLGRYDAIAFFTNNDLTVPNPEREPPMSAAGKTRLLDAISDGKGFVAFHSSCASWRTPGASFADSENVDPYIAMIGGEFVAHGPQQKATMRVSSPSFPGMKGLGDSFTLHEEWYALKNFADDLHVILVQETAGMEGECYRRPPYPSTWARKHGEGRIFFTSMAHRENVWVEQPFQQIVLGGLAWALGNVEADVAPNIDKVTPKARPAKRVSAPSRDSTSIPSQERGQ